MSQLETMAILMGGIPALNASLYRQIRFLVGDPVAYIQLTDGNAEHGSTLILRDIEMDRAKKHARASQVHCPPDFAPEGGLSGDRETATAQAAAECLKRAGIKRVRSDRSLPLIYADIAKEAGIEVICDRDLGVIDRRRKDSQEIDWLQEAQAATEAVMEMACRMVARATAQADGSLQVGNQALTAEFLRWSIDQFLLEKGYSNPASIVACGSQGGDCHNLGTGAIYTGKPVIVDIFPRNRTTLYNGDCTRTVVHGDIPDEIVKMHAAVVKAKQDSTAAVKVGVTGEAVHDATTKSMLGSGYNMGLPPEGAADNYTSMPHGTGHGIGLEVHEPPLLDKGGPELVLGDALTIEPGLYCMALGGVRVEDMVIVTEDGCVNLNKLPESLDWL